MKVELQNGDRIRIPEGCVAQIDGNEVVIEKKEQDFKDGDIIAKSKAVAILKGGFNNGVFRGYACLNFDGKVLISNDTEWSTMSAGWHIATEEERQLLFDKMEEKGLRWNAEEKKVEEIRWTPGVGEIYYYVNFYAGVSETKNVNGHADEELKEVHNQFRTYEQAEKAAAAVRETLKKFHEENE